MNFVKTTLSPHPENIEVRIDGDVLRFAKKGIDLAPKVLLSCELAETVSRYSQDHGVIAIGDRRGELLVGETTAISVGLRGSPYTSPEGTTRRDSPIAAYRSLGGEGYPALFVLTPYRGCSLDDCTLYFFGSSGVEAVPPSEASRGGSIGAVDVRVNGSPLVAEEVGILPTYLSGWLPLSLDGDTSVAAGGSASLVVSAPPGTEVYLEALAGSLSRSRARSGDVVTLSAIDLPSGTRARIKAGYKYWPGKADVEIEVV